MNTSYLLGLLLLGAVQSQAPEPSSSGPLVVVVGLGPPIERLMVAELRSVGFEVRTESARWSGNSDRVLELCLAHHQPLACIVASGNEERNDGGHGGLTVARLAFAVPGRGIEYSQIVASAANNGALRDLALKTAELLYARQRMGSVFAAPKAAAQPPPVPVKASLSRKRERPGKTRILGGSLHLGPTISLSPGGLGGVLGASLATALDLGPRISIELAGTGGGLLEPFRRGQGVARMGIASARGLFVWRPWGWLADRIAPFAAVGAGPWLAAARGQGAAGYRGRSGVRWLAGMTGVLGCSVVLPKNWTLRLDTAFTVVVPEFQLVFAGEAVARAGQPWVDTTVALGYRWGGRQ